MKKYFKIMLTISLLLVAAGCSPSSGGGAVSEQVVIMEPDDEAALPAPKYPLSVGRLVPPASE
ncbi:hypothetical protein K2P97_10510 [bacterium]|nr:hypothetical protein [bacterium]